MDPDAVRRLLDCDDYRKFIDSHSDCASSSQVSSARGQHRSPAKRSRRKVRREREKREVVCERERGERERKKEKERERGWGDGGDEAENGAVLMGRLKCIYLDDDREVTCQF